MLIDRPDLRIELLRGAQPSAIVCVTFTERTNRTLEGSGFGGDALRSAGIDVLAIKTSVDSWYQHLTPDDLAQIREAIAGYPVRTGYGSSMGGYATIRFSAALALHRVLAFSPIYDILLDWEPRYHADRVHARAPMMGSENIAPDCQYFLAYDSRQAEDARHATLFAAIIPPANLIPIRVPFGGHPVGPHLRDTGVLRPLMVAALRDGDISGIRVRPANRFRPAPALHAMAERLLETGRNEAALIVNGRALRLAPDWGELYIQRCKMLQTSGDGCDAVIAGRLAVSLMPQNVHVAAYVSAVLANDRQLDEARKLIERALAHVPDDPVLLEQQRILSGDAPEG